MFAFIELQKAKELKKELESLKVSFERQVQTERTLKIQVCGPTQVWKHMHIFYTFQVKNG